MCEGWALLFMHPPPSPTDLCSSPIKNSMLASAFVELVATADESSSSSSSFGTLELLLLLPIP